MNLVIADLPLRDVSLLMRARKLSPVELVDEYLMRISRMDKDVLAFTHVAERDARDAANRAEREIARGLTRSRLHGVPIAFKDIIAVSGMPLEAGSLVMSGHVARTDAGVVARLRRQGLVFVGKLTTNEFSAGSQQIPGPVRNPWDLRRTAGGSSAGAAAAVAARLVPLALGGDTGGSIRIPASFCGVIGLRPPKGRIDASGVIPLCPTLDEVGPLAGCVDDVELLYDAMVTDRPGGLLQPETSLARMRVALLREYVDTAFDSEVQSGFEKCVRGLEDAGAVVTIEDVPSARLAATAGWVITYAEALAFHNRSLPIRASQYSPELLVKLLGATCFSADEYALAQTLRAWVSREVRDVLRRSDIILVPTMAFPPQPLGEDYAGGDVGALTRPLSLTGLPVITVPAAQTSMGLPVGMQVVGLTMGVLFRAGRAVERCVSLGEPPIRPNPRPLLSRPTPPRDEVPLEGAPASISQRLDRERVERAASWWGLDAPELVDRALRDVAWIRADLDYLRTQVPLIEGRKAGIGWW